MNHKQSVSEFTRGVMDRIREACGIPSLTEIKLPDGSWRFITPAGDRLFRAIPHVDLMIMHKGRWELVKRDIQSEIDAEKAMLDYLKGVSS